jgi:hypothetical protein
MGWKFRKAKIASKFTAEALAIGETLGIVRKIDCEQNFVIFPDSESALKGISNTTTMNSTSHVTLMLKDKIERLQSGRKKSYFSGSLGTVQLKLMRELTRRQSNQSKKAEIVKSYYRWQILKPSGKRGRQELHDFCQNTKDRGYSCFERYYKNGSSPWFREIKMIRPASVSTVWEQATSVLQQVDLT